MKVLLYIEDIEQYHKELVQSLTYKEFAQIKKQK